MSRSHFVTGISVSSYGYARVNATMKHLHRVVMENAVGRELKSTENVHHWNKDKLNNELENLCLFRSASAHKRLHHFADRHGIHIKELRFEQPWLTPNDQTSGTSC